MIQKLFPLVFFICSISTNAQTLGNYAPASVKAGGSITVTPSSAPSNTIRITVSASTSAIFSGVLTASPSTGKVTIVDAKPVGIYTISVRAFNSAGSSTTHIFTLTVIKGNCSQGKFNGNIEVAGLSRNLNNLAVGDFDRDGKQDLAIAHEGLNTISIRLGNGAGNFSGTTEVAVGSHPYSIALGDFNRDGFEDFACTNIGNNIVVVRLGDGAGGFTNCPNVNVGLTPVSIAVTDFNGDGKQDLAVANLNTHNVSIRMGDGLGGFTGVTDIAVGIYPYSVAIGDFNNDGKTDFATANGGQNTVSIRIGNGLGGFSGTTEVPVGTNPYCVAVGDFNNDGKQDLASANYISSTISIRMGDGNGGFTGNSEIPVGSNPYFVAIGNFNGDNHMDLATANYFGNTVSIRLGNGSGWFSGNTEIAVGSYPICLAVGEFNNDGRQDMAVSNSYNHTVSIRLGSQGSLPFSSIASNSPVCEGQNIYLDAYGGYNYSWFGPNGFTSNFQHPVIATSTLINSGNYSVTINDSSNCTALTSTTIIVNPIPVVSFPLLFDTLYTNYPSIVLTSGTPAGGTYSGNGLLPGNQFDPGASGPGVYTFTYTFTDPVTGCSNSASHKIRVLLPMGLTDSFKPGDITVYPNPVKDNFTVDLSSVNTNCTLTLFTPDGKLVNEWIVPGNDTHIISTSGLAEGIYFLRLSANNRRSVFHIVKE